MSHRGTFNLNAELFHSIFLWIGNSSSKLNLVGCSSEMVILLAAFGLLLVGVLYVLNKMMVFDDIPAVSVALTEGENMNGYPIWV